MDASEDRTAAAGSPVIEGPAAAGALIASVPSPPSERRAWLIACSLCVLGVTVLVAVLSGAVGQTARVDPPAMLAVASTPLPGSLAGGRANGHPSGSIVARPSAAQQTAEAERLAAASHADVATRWMEGFYPIYATAQGAFGVDWLLLASIHMQESAFSTAPGTYHGLNFLHCCGGPMQFNVTNGPVTTWDLVRDSYLYAPRPARYDHMAATHPSIYDDFDSIMAAARLLAVDGASSALDESAWIAAYDYYGHDATGVAYADQVLARAIGWSQHGFCFGCGVEPVLVEAVHAAYGAPVLAALQASPPRSARARAASPLSGR